MDHYKLFACGFRHRMVGYDVGDGYKAFKHQLFSYSHLCVHVFTPQYASKWGEKVGFRESTLRDTTWAGEQVFGHCGAVLTSLWAMPVAHLPRGHADPPPRDAKTVTPRLLLVQSGCPSETQFRDVARPHAAWEWVFG